MAETGGRVVVVGASAGGVEALQSLVASLPANFSAPVIVVLHVAPSASSVLPAILERAGALEARHVVDGEVPAAGTVYVAPPDHHVLVTRTKGESVRLRLSRGPRVNGHRPAVDPLFMSAARVFGSRAISIVLSGVLDDGTSGTHAVMATGGTTIAQSPETARYAAMPRNAIEQASVKHVVETAAMGPLLAQLLAEGASAAGEAELEGDVMADVDVEGELEVDPEGSAKVDGAASGFTCPDCHGALWELDSGRVVRYRCRIGHSYGATSLLAMQSENIEAALWAGYRALEENAALAQRLAERMRARGVPALAERYEDRGKEALARAKTLKAVLERGQIVAELESDDG